MTRSGRSPQRASRERNDVMHDVGMTDDDEHSLSDVFDGTVDPASGGDSARGHTDLPTTERRRAGTVEERPDRTVNGASRWVPVGAFGISMISRLRGVAPDHFLFEITGRHEHIVGAPRPPLCGRRQGRARTSRTT